MHNARNKEQKKARRIARVRAIVRGSAERPRFTVRRTLSHMYAQVIDDVTGKTLAAASDQEVSMKGTKTEVAAEVGKLIAERALARQVTSVVFDRRDKKFHGRVKALADAARAAGLNF